MRAVIAVSLTLVCLGCGLFGGVVGTRIVVKGRHTTLREQVLGSFEELEDEVYLLAGVRAVDPVSGAPKAPPEMTESEQRALAARRSMEFNHDDVLSFKRAGHVGEGSDGLLVFFDGRKSELQAADARLSRLVSGITAEENNDRLVIMRRIVETTPGLDGPAGFETVGRILAERYRQEAEPGMRVQLPDGSWAVKGER